MNIVPVETLRRWADLAAFCVDNPGREAADAVLELSAQLEDALEDAIEAETGRRRDWCRTCGQHRGTCIERAA